MTIFKMTLFLSDRYEINKYTVGLVLNEYNVNWEFNESEEGSELYDNEYDFTLDVSKFICYINLDEKKLTRFIKQDFLNNHEFKNCEKKYILKFENVGTLRSIIQKLTGGCKYNLDGKWREFYKKYQNIFLEYKDSGVAQLFNLLNKGFFPLIHSTLDYDCDSEYHKYFTLFWTGRFFIQIPFINVESHIFLVLTAGGLVTKFNTIEEIADHLIDNVKYYQKKIGNKIDKIILRTVLR